MTQLRAVRIENSYDFDVLKAVMLETLEKSIDGWGKRVAETETEIGPTLSAKLESVRNQLINDLNKQNSDLPGLLLHFNESAVGQEITPKSENGSALKIPADEMCQCLIAAIDAGSAYLSEHGINGDAALSMRAARRHLVFKQNADSLQKPKIPNATHYLRRGYCNQQELEDSVLLAAAETFHAMKALGLTKGLDEEDRAQLDRVNQQIFQGLNHQLSDPEGSTYLQIQSFIDNSVKAYYQCTPRDEVAKLFISWPIHFLKVLSKQLKTNSAINTHNEQAGNAVSLFNKRTLRARSKLAEDLEDESVSTHLQSLRALRSYANAGKYATEHCDEIIQQCLGGNKGQTALEVIAECGGQSLAELDEEALESLNEELESHLIEYMQSHFFDRVKSRVKDINLTELLTFAKDDEEVEIPFPLQSYALVRMAYSMAEAAAMRRGFPKGTDMYESALHKLEDQLLTTLAKSGCWECALPEDFTTARKKLKEESANLSKGPAKG